MSESKENIDIDETPQSRQRKKFAKEMMKGKKENRVVAEWYSVAAGKLLMYQKMTNGNVCSTWVASASQKGSKTLIASLKEQGKMKPQGYKP